MGLFSKSFQDEVNEALEKLRGRFPKASIAATVEGKTVTLSGEAPDMDTKTKIMTEFNSMVKSDNTVNQIAVPKPAGAATPAATSGMSAPAPGAAGGGSRVHEVVSGDTLSALAKKYYGNASSYPKIFEANRDILDNPDRIKVGQKLKIPG